jgi:hypothetical protein
VRAVFRKQERKIESQVKLVRAVAEVGRRGPLAAGRSLVGLAHHHAVVVRIEDLPELPQHVMRLGPVLVIDMSLQIIGARGVRAPAERVAPELLVFYVPGDRVQPEAVHAPVQPEAQLSEDGLAAQRVAQVQVRLLF